MWSQRQPLVAASGLACGLATAEARKRGRLRLRAAGRELTKWSSSLDARANLCSSRAVLRQTASRPEAYVLHQHCTNAAPTESDATADVRQLPGLLTSGQHFQ